MSAFAQVVGSHSKARAAPTWGVRLRARIGAWLLVLLVLGMALPGARAEPPELLNFELTRGEDGLALSYNLRFELSRPVEEALTRGVPLYFVAEADVFRGRWYWRDKRIGGAARTWRLAWQPLTRRYRLSLGSLSQNHDRLEDALAAMQSTSRWKLAEAAALDDGARQYVEFRFRLDTEQLPRPLQIGLGNQADWNLALEHVAPVPEAAR